MSRLSDAVALITGASSGIGATARTHTDAGAAVILAARRKVRLEALQDEIEAPKHMDVSEALLLPSGQRG